MNIDRADALDWLAGRERGMATVIVFDPPYAVGTPVRGREDGAAGSVFGPLSFMSKTLALSAAALRPGGVCMLFADWRRMADLAYIATTVGLRASTCIAWTRKRPGTGGLFRSAWDPILLCSRGVPDAIDRAAIRNVIEADYPTRRVHPYEKPADCFRHVFPRICKPGDLVLDPFAGSGVSGRVAAEFNLRWAGCDIDPAFAIADEALTATIAPLDGSEWRERAAHLIRQCPSLDGDGHVIERQAALRALLAASPTPPVAPQGERGQTYSAQGETVRDDIGQAGGR